MCSFKSGNQIVLVYFWSRLKTIIDPCLEQGQTLHKLSDNMLITKSQRSCTLQVCFDWNQSSFVLCIVIMMRQWHVDNSVHFLYQYAMCCMFFKYICNEKHEWNLKLNKHQQTVHCSSLAITQILQKKTSQKKSGVDITLHDQFLSTWHWSIFNLYEYFH